ncbi:MAG: DEAD/DEAH box helicase [Firmicutes bacterium]|nr:DEAD/DEAH box helicase [Bacillota bacterium]
MDQPLIVQSDMTILVEVANPFYERARDLLLRFADLEKSPEHVHTYRITPISLWNAAASGMTAAEITETLASLSKYPVPQNVVHEIGDYVGRYGRLKMYSTPRGLEIVSTDDFAIAHAIRHPQVKPFIMRQMDSRTLLVAPDCRGRIKQALTRLGYPVEDLAGYVNGEQMNLSLRSTTRAGLPFALRPYQEAAVKRFYADGAETGGSGVIVLPCGAGKTVVGMGVMTELQEQTLILSTNIVAVRQWIDELLDKSDLTEDQIGEYSGEKKEIRPVTVSTYQVLTHRKGASGEYPHFSIFSQRNWGLIVYDEVHLLPAPVFRITAELQARRRLGLTATLVREDGREHEVFSLIGPKRFDVPWKDLEKEGWIAAASCFEIRVEMDQEHRLEYAVADEKNKYRVASENPRKTDIVMALLKSHETDQVLVIGQYLDQLNKIAEITGAPLITGQVPNSQRQRLYDQFKKGELRLLIVSKVANFAIDLPDASVAIQVSGTFGSRQEEAQRLGRILRPKKNGAPARLYSLVTRDTKDQEFAQNRQLFLTEQGYNYTIMNEAAFLEELKGAGIE